VTDFGHPKVLDRETLAERIRLLRKEGRRVVFTNGCFDLLHVGHVRYLAAARAQGDHLVAGLNSDVSVRTIKGELRPVVPQDQRAEVLAALACVDFVTLFDEPDPLALILALRPDVLVKGADWAEADIVGAAEVKRRGGRVARIPVVGGASTTGIIQRIRERYGAIS
jgi:D-glycero-beta-D-manno-heptose 1-phosphate adenylyltransferase